MLAPLVDLLFPARCVGCGRAGAVLCPVCAPVGLVDVRAGPGGGLAVRAATSYEAAMRTALIAYKERGRRDLARPLGGLLAAALPTSAAATWLVPVPSTRAARRARGGDHVARLARVAARVTARSAAPRAGPARVAAPLRWMRSVEDSAGLDAASRAANVRHAMRAAPPPGPGSSAVLVDDIVTTGATLVEAARALHAAGWRVECAAVVAATPRRARMPRAMPSPHAGPFIRLAGRTGPGLP